MHGYSILGSSQGTGSLWIHNYMYTTQIINKEIMNITPKLDNFNFYTNKLKLLQYADY